MDLEAMVTNQMAGVLLILSVMLPFLGLIIIARGDFSGFQASIRGIAGVGESVDILRRTFPVAPLSVVLSLASFGMLTALLHQTGDKIIAVLAFILLLFSQIFMVFQGTFHSSVTVWAAKRLAKEGEVPELFEPLWQWMYTTVQKIYVDLGLLAIATYGWSILQTELFPPWLGWSSIAWSGGWLFLFFITKDNLPLVLFVPPVVIGVTALLM